jgi:hypothetical protein
MHPEKNVVEDSADASCDGESSCVRLSHETCAISGLGEDRSP